MVKGSLAKQFFLYGLFLISPLLFFTDLTRNPYYTQIALLNVLTLLFWLSYVVRSTKTGAFQWHYTSIDFPFWAFFTVCILSLGVSIFQHPHFLLPIYSEGGKKLIFLLVNAYLVYAAALRFGDKSSIRLILGICYIASVFAAIYGIAQYFGIEWVWAQNLNPYGNRPVATFGNPNFLSSYLVMISAVMAADFCVPATGFSRPFVGMFLVINLAALLATLTRSSWAGWVIACLILTVGISRAPVFKPQDKRWISVLAGVILLIVLAWPSGRPGQYGASVMERLTELKKVRTESYSPVSQRALIWLCAWEMVQDHPVVGKGAGTFELFYPFYQGPQLFTPTFRFMRTHANNSHNEILETWSQVGTLGLGLWILFWVTFFFQAIAVARRAAWPWQALHWGFIAGVAGMLTDNLLNVSMQFAVPAMILWWWVGASLAMDPAAVQTKTWSLKSIFSKGLLGLAAGTLILLTIRSVLFWLAEIHFFTGFKLSKNGRDLVAAAQSLEKARTYHPLEVNNNYELANVYARLSSMPEALRMYDKSLDANSGYDEIHFNQATMLMKSGHIAEAIAGYQRCLAINPTSREAYNALSGLYFKDLKGNATLIDAMFKRALALYPEDRDFWNNYGYFLTQQGRWEEAFQAFHRAVEIDPDFELAYKSLLTIKDKIPSKGQDPILRAKSQFAKVEGLIGAGRWDEALSPTEELVQTLPNSFRAHFDLANVYFGLGRLSEAITHYQTTLQRRPDLVTGWINLGIALEKTGQLTEAKAAYEHGLQLDPKNPAALQRLATLTH